MIQQHSSLFSAVGCSLPKATYVSFLFTRANLSSGYTSAWCSKLTVVKSDEVRLVEFTMKMKLSMLGLSIREISVIKSDKAYLVQSPMKRKLSMLCLNIRDG